MASDGTPTYKSGRERAIMDRKVFGHPAGLFVLFFTEMWERFSFYGMRVLLINFLTMSIIGVNPGWDWSISNATALYGTYAALLYLTPIIGGMIADKYIGYRRAVLIGCTIMALGHASMAVETPTFLYIGLTLLVVGTGFFKPNITSIISNMYAYLPEKEDSAYTLYYMGVNSGAFFGMMLCGYLGERVGWSYGFGLAGVFMVFGTLQFLFAKKIFGGIGEPPKKQDEEKEQLEKQTKTPDQPKKESPQSTKKEKQNPFTVVDIILIAAASIIGLLYIFNEPTSKIGNFHLLPEKFGLPTDVLSGSNAIILIGIAIFLILIFTRIARYKKIVRDRMIALIIFAFFTVIFFGAFEQAATSMITFARDFTQRVLTGTAATVYNIVNTLLTVIPLLIVTWVLYVLNKRSFMKIPVSNVILALCFALMWGLAIYMLYQNFSSRSYEVEYQQVALLSQSESENVNSNAPLGKNKNAFSPKENVGVFSEFEGAKMVPITEGRPLKDDETPIDSYLETSSSKDLDVGESVPVHKEVEKYRYLDEDQLEDLRGDYSEIGKPSQIIHGQVSEIKQGEVEITVSWFSILNSFFIIALSSLFSKWWESKYNPSAAIKYGLGLILLGVGFAILAFGSRIIPPGAAAGMIRVSMLWLILFYLFNTLGELCLSPVGLSYLSKLVPTRMIAFMFGMWYLAIAIGNYVAAKLGGMSEKIQESQGMPTFFLIFAFIPIGVGIIAILLNPLLKRLMHGVK